MSFVAFGDMAPGQAAAAYTTAERLLAKLLREIVVSRARMKWWLPRHTNGLLRLIEMASNALGVMKAAARSARVVFGRCSPGMNANTKNLRDYAVSGIAALADIRDDGARRAASQAVKDLLGLLMSFRDAEPVLARTSNWSTWLATTFVGAGVRQLLGGDGTAVYYKLIEAMVVHYRSDDQALAEVATLKHGVLAFLAPFDNVPGGPTGENAAAVRTLRGLLTR
jgi:hypothetical protein